VAMRALVFRQGMARLACARPGRSAKRGLSRSNPLSTPRSGVPALATSGNLITVAPAALPVPAALPGQVLPAVLPVQVSQAPPERAAMSRQSPEPHP
jgi:hypothetical protein